MFTDMNITTGVTRIEGAVLKYDQDGIQSLPIPIEAIDSFAECCYSYVSLGTKQSAFLSIPANNPSRMFSDYIIEVKKEKKRIILDVSCTDVEFETRMGYQVQLTPNEFMLLLNNLSHLKKVIDKKL